MIDISTIYYRPTNQNELLNDVGGGLGLMKNIYLIYCSNDVLVNGSQDRILFCKFRVKVCCLFLAFLKKKIIEDTTIDRSILTIFGLKGGLILLSSRSFHLTSLKKGRCLIASSPPWFYKEDKFIKNKFSPNL